MRLLLTEGMSEDEFTDKFLDFVSINEMDFGGKKTSVNENGTPK